VCELTSLLNVANTHRLLQVNKYFSNFFWDSLQTVVAQTPVQMAQINYLLEKLEMKSVNRLTQVKNVAFWAVPVTPFPVNGHTFNLLSTCINLRRLIIGKGQNAMLCTADDFKQLASCKNLELLEIDQTTLDSNALSVVEKLTQLVSLRVRGLDASLPPSLLPLLRNHTKLKRLGIWVGKGKINDNDIIFLSQMAQLTELILSNCASQGNPETFAVLKALKLKHLGLFYSDLDDSNFKHLLDITTLTSFHVGGCWNLTSSTISNIRKLSNLVNFSISRASLNKQCMIEIASNSTIRTLRISACPLLTDEDLEPLLTMEITRLDLDNTRLISDATLIHLSKHTSLQELYLMGIPRITNTGVMKLEQVVTLNILFIKKCDSVTNAAVDYLKQKRMDVAFTLLRDIELTQQIPI
jgi:hypothetical protein